VTELLADGDGPAGEAHTAQDDEGVDQHSTGHGAAGVGAMVAVLGVVYGDIGTSPLYALQTVFSIDHGAVRASAGDVYGVISLVFWSITVVVSVKYVTFILRADNNGEGGVMALAALLRRALGNTTGRRAKVVMAVGVFGAALFYGDSVITPAISVLSAVEGLKVAAPGLSNLVVPLAAVILGVLFVAQRWGTTRIGSLFGPVMLLWFLTLAIAGLREIVPHPGILRGLSPSYAGAFIAAHPYTAFIALGAVVLAITGAEALYADMGHFGPRPIRRAWFALVFPALTLNYLAQGALILRNPATKVNPFFLLVPNWAQIPMVILATLATVIASQAVISGAFSVSRQAVRLGFLPHLQIRHTSAEEIGQVYVPAVNWALFASVLVLIAGFGSSARLATAYGVAVTGTFLITTTLFLVLARALWHWTAWKLLLTAVVFGTAEITYFAANLTKIAHGRWLPLLIAAHRLHDHDDLAARPRDRHRPPHRVGRHTARLHHRAAQTEGATGTRNRRIPAPRRGHHPARPARERRTQSHPARADHHHLRPDSKRAAHPLGAATERRAPRRSPRRHPPHPCGLRVPGSLRHPGSTPPGPLRDPRGRNRTQQPLLLPLPDHAAPHPSTGHEHLA